MRRAAAGAARAGQVHRPVLLHRSALSALRTDLLIVGGGLAGGLAAIALAQRRPEIAVTLIEQGPTLGGNHLWSFFDSDVDESDRAIVAPLVCHCWLGYDIAFPGHRRALGGTYNSIESERLDAVVRAMLPAERLLTGRSVASVDPAGAVLAGGARIEAAGVIDARGFAGGSSMTLGWQKFLGQLLQLDAPHGLTRPVIMDATVEQFGAYRFVYLLPFDARHVFVEDTYYADTPDIDHDELTARIAAYADARGWQVAAIEREEAAALPIAIGGEPAPPGPLPRIGMAAGLFQPMTGYSLPDAVRTASLIAGLPDLRTPALAATLRDYAAARWSERGFYRLLGRMLFRAAEPGERWRVLERFYRLDEGLIARFYAGSSTFLDKARILAGKPPVPLGRAFAVLRET